MGLAMFKYSALIILFLITACATYPGKDVSLSTAVISNVKIEEELNLSQHEHNIQVHFDYHISDFHSEPGLYLCTIQFQSRDGRTISHTGGNPKRCKIEAASGHIDIDWFGPIDRHLALTQKQLQAISLPLTFRITLHQWTGHNQTTIIAESESFTSKLESQVIKPAI